MRCKKRKRKELRQDVGLIRQRSVIISVVKRKVVLNQRSPRGAVMTALCRRVVPVSTFTRLVSTPDPTRGSSPACAPPLSSSSSTGNRGSDLVIHWYVVSYEKPPDVVRFICVVSTESSLRIVLCGWVKYTGMWVEHGACTCWMLNVER